MSEPPEHHARPPSSRRRYRGFVEDYKKRRLDAPALSPAPEPGAQKRNTRRDYLRAYLRNLRPHRAAVGTVLALALAVAGLEMAEPLFMRFIVDRVLLDTTADPAARLATLHLAGGAFLAVVVLAKLAGVLKDYRQKLLNVRVMLSLRRALYDRLLHLPLPKLWGMKTGGILSRLSGDIDTTTGLLQMAVVSPALSLVRLVIAVGVLLALNWRLALMALAVVPGAVLMSFAFARRVRPIYRSARKDVEAIDGRAGETFGGIRVVRAFGPGDAGAARLHARPARGAPQGAVRAPPGAVLWTSWGLLVAGVNVVIVWYGGYLVVAGRASVGDVMAFQWYALLLMGPVWSIVNSFSELQRSLAAMERVFEVLAAEADKPDRPGAADAPAVVTEVRFEGVEFEYDAGRPVVRALDVVVPGGSVVALVGRSGAGKTTVTDLVARFHDPTRGRILVNGTDVRDFRLRTYRALLALVQQDTFLFDGPVRDNIAYGRPGATDAEVEDAARRAHAHEFIANLPDGYRTVVGERGVRLSGGQRQRLAIARAILARPQILILDEATSSLDTESEQLIQASMAALLAGRTTFVIAHRLSTVQRADLILLLEDGRVVERGTHDELMAARGAYHGMVLRQMAAHDQDVEGARGVERGRPGR
jgi:ATP-binding cassette subfamily B protein/subfamily B ATP-binding cassette protein MsbA